MAKMALNVEKYKEMSVNLLRIILQIGIKISIKKKKSSKNFRTILGHLKKHIFEIIFIKFIIYHPNWFIFNLILSSII